MDRVLHIVVPNITEAEEARNKRIGGDGPWAIESYLRNKGVQMALQSFQPSPGDWIMHSDIDELPRASTLAEIKASSPSASSSSPEKGNNTELQTRVIHCEVFYYSFEFKRAEPLKGPVLVQFQPAATGVDPNSDEPVELNDKGLRVFNKPLWEDWPNQGKDLFLRNEKYSYVGPPIDVPKFVTDHPDRFAYLTHRYKVPNASFLDVPEDYPSLV
ncbi:hypothetical protein DFQ27_004989 [Actinomortierella ambigua]|uniref:Uncharacterized protein n=1 Tax=Actinomortierella ambigua TaxID=1343610 RepID=A0A9P6UCH8_9FUNG|nr:hypothetical protein DFQ27_004989 [Actinomortierella ambigua]